LSVLDHVAQLADACFPGLPLKVLPTINESLANIFL